MAKTKTKKEEGVDIFEDPDVLAGKAEQFFSNTRNRNLVFGIGGTIAAIVAAVLIYRFYITNQNIEAQQEMFQAVYYFEADSLGKALNGDGNSYGFLDIIDSYAGTEAANLSQFYSGATYLKMGDFSSAERYLEAFSASDYVVQARAFSLIGDARLEQGNVAGAIAAYKQAADYMPNKEFTPVYLQKLGIAEESNGNFTEASKAYGRIVEEFPNSSLLQEAKKHKSRLQGLAAE